MQYKLHRVAPNSEGWVRPSPGRLGQITGVGEDVKRNGFGHEDWNFNFDLAVDGQMIGYTVARPAQGYAGEEFKLVLATYDAGGWRAAGYYDGAIYLKEPALRSEVAIEQMAIDIYQLAEADEVASRYREMTLMQIQDFIRNNFIHSYWSVPEDRVVVFPQPVPIPEKFFNPGRQRMMIPFNLDENKFDAITKLGADVSAAKREHAEEEGSRTLRLHWAVERNPRLVAAFKASLSSFACTICGFDFGKTYSDLGANFIECHHTRPVAKMRPGDVTRLTDLCAVCSNCHRMLHRRLPLLTPDELRSILK